MFQKGNNTIKQKKHMDSTMISVVKESFKDVSVYNVRNKQVLKVKLGKAVHVSFPSVLLVEDALYIIGGCLAYGYNPYTHVAKLESPNVFQRKTSMHVARCGHALAHLKHEWIYAVGGYSDTLGYLASCEKYTISTNVWTSIPPLTEGRTLPSLCSVNNRFLYLLGGYPVSEKPPGNHIEFMDATDEESGWKRLGFTQPRSFDPWDSRCGSLMVQVSPVSVLIFGGKLMLNAGQFLVLDLLHEAKHFFDRDFFDVCTCPLPGCRGGFYTVSS